MAEYDTEIDLRPLAAALLKGWRRILAAVLVTTMAVIAFGLSLPRHYSSSATLLLTRSRSVMELADQFPTINETIDSRSRLEAVLSIANSDAVASRVVEELRGQIPEAYLLRTGLHNRVDVSSKGDTILVTVRMEQPEHARAVASVWAHHAVAAINQAYRGGQPLDQLENQLALARTSYEQAQNELEDFLANSPIALLEAEVKQAEETLTLISNGHIKKIEIFELRRQSVQSLNLQARALLAQLDSGSRSQPGAAGDALAVTLARANLLAAISSSEPIFPQVQVQLDVQGDAPLDRAQAAGDLRSLVELTDAEIARLDGDLQALYAQLSASQSSTEIEAAATRLNELTTRLEVSNSQQTQLQSARDLSWQAYRALVEKSVEIRNTAQVSDRISLAADAVLPDEPDSRGLIMLVGVGALVGLLLGALWALYPLLREQVKRLAAG